MFIWFGMNYNAHLAMLWVKPINFGMKNGVATMKADGGVSH